MKKIFTISMLLLSVSLFARDNDNDITGRRGNDNDIITPVLDSTSGTTGTTGTSSTVGTMVGTHTDTFTSNLTAENTTPIIELNTDGYKAEFKEYRSQQKIAKAIDKAAIKEDAKKFGKEISAIIKGCKISFVGNLIGTAPAKDYNAKNICFLNKIRTMNNEKHRFILSTIAAGCEASYEGYNTDQYTMQRKYLCYRNALRAAIKTRKGLVIGWGDKDENTDYIIKPIESSTIEGDSHTPPTSGDSDIN